MNSLTRWVLTKGVDFVEWLGDGEPGPHTRRWRKALTPPPPPPPTREEILARQEKALAERIEELAKKRAQAFRLIDAMPIDEEEKEEIRGLKDEEFRNQFREILP